jgi:hypothetical protein
MMAGRDEKGRFIKGSSGNASGRAPRVREERYYEILRQSVSEDDWKAIIVKAISQAKHGDQQARKWIADYLIGPPIERKEVTGADGNALQIIIVDETAIDSNDA